MKAQRLTRGLPRQNRYLAVTATRSWRGIWARDVMVEGCNQPCPRPRPRFPSFVSHPRQTPDRITECKEYKQHIGSRPASRSEIPRRRAVRRVQELLVGGTKFRLRHLVSFAAPDRPSVGGAENTSNAMSLVLLLSLTLGRRDCKRWGPSVRDATLEAEDRV